MLPAGPRLISSDSESVLEIFNIDTNERTNRQHHDQQVCFADNNNDDGNDGTDLGVEGEVEVDGVQLQEICPHLGLDFIRDGFALGLQVGHQTLVAQDVVPGEKYLNGI